MNRIFSKPSSLAIKRNEAEVSTFSSIVRRAALNQGVFLGGLLVLLVSGCTLLPPASPDLTKYYVLTSQESTMAPVRSATAVRVALRAIELPGYLRNTKTMVVRAGANEIRYQDYARWAEPLDVGLTRVLREVLLHSENIASVERPPFSAESLPKYELTVRINFCEGVVLPNKGEARLVVAYEISAMDTHHAVAEKTFTASAKSWDGKDYGALAEGLSAEVAALGEEIAATLQKQ